MDERKTFDSEASELDGSVCDEYGSNAFDKKDMKRMGKEQKLIRNFRSFSSVALASCVMGTWEILLTVNTPALIAGGLAGLFWSIVWGSIGQFFVVLSIAEMSSMAPTAGGQYHWVSEFAPRRFQKPLSYTSGWLSALGWQAFVAADSYVCGTMIQSIIQLQNSDYQPKAWHTTLLIIAVVTFMGAFNIFFARKLAIAENVFAILHFGASIPIIIALVATTDKFQPASEVFLHFTDNGGGWPSTGLTVLVGQVSAMFTVLGSDSVAHMSEEVHDAGATVPRSILLSYFINVPIAFSVLIAFLFCIGDVTEAIDSGSPFVYAFRSATGTANGATGLTIVMFFLLIVISTSTFAATSRQTWAFARDKGLPFSKWLFLVSPRFHVPINSVIITTAFTALLSLINIGSTVAFDAVLSLGVVALMATYMLSIGCVLVRRLVGQPLPKARWSLGRAGPAVNIIGLIYAFYAFFWSFWPYVYQPTADTFNWACVLFVGVMLLALLQYFVKARKLYTGPVVTVIDDDDSSR